MGKKKKTKPKNSKSKSHIDEKLVLINELHRQVRRKFPRRKIIVKGLFESLEIDLVDMQKFSRENSGFKYYLAAICTFSKVGFCRPIHTKSAGDVTEAMESILKEIKKRGKQNIVSHCSHDSGKEFLNKQFRQLMEKYGINQFVTKSEIKSSIVERWNRTIKNKLYRKFSYNFSYKWVDILPKVVKEYNNTRHSTIKMAPNEVTHENAPLLLKSVYNYTKYFKKPRFKVGDLVRTSKKWKIFQRSFHVTHTYEVFRIKKIQLTFPLTYILEDLQGNLIEGAFYSEELQEAKTDLYLVEKIKKTKKPGFVEVKWLGISETSILPKRNILK